MDVPMILWRFFICLSDLKRIKWQGVQNVINFHDGHMWTTLIEFFFFRNDQGSSRTGHQRRRSNQSSLSHHWRAKSGSNHFSSCITTVEGEGPRGSNVTLFLVNLDHSILFPLVTTSPLFQQRQFLQKCFNVFFLKKLSKIHLIQLLKFVKHN